MSPTLLLLVYTEASKICYYFPARSAVFMFSRLATVLQELSGEEAPDGDQQVREQRIH